MTKCPFCQGQTTQQHSAQDCLSHMRARLREMTERRDALQVSLDNHRRNYDKLRSRKLAVEQSLTATIAEYRAVIKQHQQAERAAVAALVAIKRRCEVVVSNSGPSP